MFKIDAMCDDFVVALKLAQEGNTEAVERILADFMPLIEKYSYVNRQIDEDLLSELCLAAFLCVKRFKVDCEDMEQFFRTAGSI